jgi:hypothetical protein
MTEQLAEPDTRERNPKVQMAWGLLAPYIASEDSPDLSDDDQAEILTAGALPQVWSIILELEQRVERLEEALYEAIEVGGAPESAWVDTDDETKRAWPHLGQRSPRTGGST